MAKTSPFRKEARSRLIVAGANKLEMAKFTGAGTPGAVAGSPSDPAASAATQMASLQVDSSVPGADLEMHGGFVGNTPSTLSVTRQHTVTVKKKGYADWSWSMNVAGTPCT